MLTYLITYDLKQPGRDYPPLHRLLGVQWKASRVAESVWIAELKGPASAVLDVLRSVTDPTTRIFVLEIKPRSDWASFRANPAGLNILKRTSP